jgi:hypothetical protein
MYRKIIATTYIEGNISINDTNGTINESIPYENLANPFKKFYAMAMEESNTLCLKASDEVKTIKLNSDSILFIRDKKIEAIKSVSPMTVHTEDTIYNDIYHISFKDGYVMSIQMLGKEPWQFAYNIFNHFGQIHFAGDGHSGYKLRPFASSSLGKFSTNINIEDIF